jgi:hypothetical protein
MLSVIKRGKSLYKGDNSKYLNQYIPQGSVTLTRGPAFFAFKTKDAEQYGVVFKFTTTEQLNVINLDSKAAFKALYEKAPQNIRVILQKNYGYHNDENKIGIRDSSHAADRELSEYICQLGYDGYILRSAKTDGEGNFHKELMLCNMSKVRFSTIVTNPGTIDAQKLRNKMNEDDINKQFKKNREGLKRRRSVLTSPVHSLFMGSPMSYGTSEHGTLSPIKMISFLSPTKKTGGKGSQKKRKTRSNRRTRRIR